MLVLPDALVFDFDGTFIDTEAPEFESVGLMWAEFGRELTIEHWQQFIGHAGFDWVRDLEHELGRHLDRAPLESRRRRINADLLEHQGPRAGVKELIDQAETNGVPVGIASNAPEAWVEHHLERTGMTNRILAVRAIEHVARGKPAPDVYLSACEALGARTERSIAFEDSVIGVTAAKRAGLFTVATPHALSAGHDLSAADLVVPSLASVALESLTVGWRA
jgi:HAD superfamily hydrolase (TIGR01509 family)